MQKSSTVAILDNNKILLLKRGKTAPWMPEKYCLPGGGVENNESLIDAAIREVNEEIGINLSSGSISPVRIVYKNDYSKIIFVTKYNGNSILLNYEHSEFGWFNFSQCENLYSNKLLVPRLMTAIKQLFKLGLMVV
jgi:8-oxo-dGTP pyrophosphatase MutT (NUDIX family)